MRISRLAWDDYRVDHVARHGVDPEEVWEVCCDPFHLAMSRIKLPEFTSYDEEAAFWDNLDTADLMEDDGEWFHFDVADERAVRVAILPDVVRPLAQRARAQGVSIETLVNAWLIKHMHKVASPA